MPAAVDYVLTVGDLRQVWRWTVYEKDVNGVDQLATLTDAKVLMINAATGVVKVNYATATIANPGVATYQPVAGDVDTAGDYYLWLRDITSGRPQHWPDDGRSRRVRFVPAA